MTRTHTIAFEFSAKEIAQLKAGARFYYQVELDNYGTATDRGVVRRNCPKWAPELKNRPWRKLEKK